MLSSMCITTIVSKYSRVVLLQYDTDGAGFVAMVR